MDEIDGNNTDRGVGRSTSVVVRDSRKLETVLRSKSLSDLLGKGKEKEKALSSTLKPLKPLDSDPYVLLPPPIVSGALTSGAHEIDKSSIHSDSDIISEMCLNDRFSTVRRFPKPAFKRIEAISPLTEGTILLDIGSSSAQLPISSGILAPLKNASFLKVSNPVFHESQSPCPDNSDLYSFEFGEEQVTKRSPTSHLVTIKSPPLGKKKLKTNGYIITILVLSVIMLFIIAGFIVTALYLANGTEASVMNYFKNANYVQKFSLLSKLNQIYPIPEKKASETKIIGSNELLEATPNGRKLGGRNSFNGIPLQLQSDEEIKKLMVNDKFQDEPIFFGVAYSPSNSLEPNCGDKPRDIMLDVAVLSKVTGRIKNYGMQCSQSEYILQAIQDLNLNMTLSMGIWIGRSRTINNSQMKEFKTVIQKYPRHFFESIFIGNEVLFRQDQNEDSLIEYIQEAKSFLISLGYGDIPVGTTEIGSLISSKLVDACDVVGANVHPYFGGVEVKQATNWVYDFLRYQIPAGSSHKIQITEVGWPYEGGKFQNAIADPASFQTFLHDYVCEAYQNEYGWYYFEAFDEPWKKVFYEGNNRWETEWGIFTNDRMIKSGISLPRCQQ